MYLANMYRFTCDQKSMVEMLDFPLSTLLPKITTAYEGTILAENLLLESM
jgi:hypothetical protein